MRRVAPYQVFFPLGFLNALTAVGVWFVQNLGWFETPVMMIHSKLIAGGFLWSFIVGFLMTAIPRMASSSEATRIEAGKSEYAVALGLLACLTIFSWRIDARYFYAAQAILVCFLLGYAGRRILKSTKKIPIFFSHVAIALTLALLGCYYHYVGNSLMGLHLYHVGTTLLLILGIGTRFFSFLSGLPSAFEDSVSVRSKVLFHLYGVSMAVLLFLAGQAIVLSYLGLALLSLIYLFTIWRIQRPSDRPSPLKYGVRIVALMIPCSFFLSWLWPSMLVTWFHLLFIGCFSLITFAVATRVTLAHGAYSTDLEMRSKPLLFLVLFLSLGVVSRVMYGFTEGNWQKSSLHLAATFWFLALGFWGWAFLPRVFQPGPQSKPSC